MYVNYLLLSVVVIIASSTLASILWILVTWKTSSLVLGSLCNFRADDAVDLQSFKTNEEKNRYENIVIGIVLIYILIFLPWNIIYNYIKGRF